MPYIAIEGFEHLKRYRKGDAIDDTLSPATLKKLEQRKLIAPANHPTKATGTPQSASPVAPASPEQTSKPSKRGAKRAKAEGSSSPTTPGN